MLEISNLKIYDLKESVIASGNAMRLTLPEYTEEEFQKGLKRMIRLVNASNTSDIHCHDNALTGIRVSFDIKYPQYLSLELQRYHWIDIVTSSSKMHRLSKMKLKDCCNMYVDPKIINLVQQKIEAYNEICQNPVDDKKIQQMWEYAAFMDMLSNCPLGLELFMRVSTNYKQLQTIYHQRRHHKLQDWHTFCKMIESLPYFKELILGESPDEET